MAKYKTTTRLKLIVALSWKDIFPEKIEKGDVIDILTGIDPDFLLLIICAINQSFVAKESFELKLLNSLSDFEQIKYRYKIHKILSSITPEDSNSYNRDSKCIFNVKANSLLIKKIVENYNYLKEKATNVFESFPFIQAYLIFNEEVFPKNKFMDDIPDKYFKSLAQFIISAKTIDFDFVYHQLFIFVRLRSLFEYLCRNYEGFLQKFEKKYQINGLDKYIFDQLSLLNYLNDKNYIDFDLKNTYEIQIREYCEELCINSVFNRGKINNIELKYYPLLKDPKNSNGYFVLNKAYFFLNFYHKIKFQAFQFLKDEYKVFNTYNDFSSEYAEKGGEEILFRNLIKLSLKNKYYKIIFNDNDKSLLDCLIFNNRHIFLFEFKDYESINKLDSIYNYQEVEKIISENFVEKKGVSQLISMMKRLKNNADFNDIIVKKNIKLHNVEIYSILVVSNSFYNIPALEHYLGLKMIEKVNTLDLGFKKIHNLAMIDLNSLVELTYYNNQFDLVKCLKEYALKKKKFNENVTLPNYPSFRECFIKSDVVKNSDFLTQFLKLTNFEDNNDIKVMSENFFKQREKKKTL
ncbi:hypothetical protein [Chryseobacterium daecheongense]|uniref:NERD domain-containing protein n=1 Tax=Chryseobacterium daecheongense TaxID=192389 RepID=A0A3N0W740_9FLAO|nr:hypothetical protein [Chryseobacterium daecheongense]ROI00847.1 hypothetical protein EGI05_08285 [Chryseobacterium daecheongense]TDX90321.1 hypothetical protein BCF50_3521 [Chryseobacterium daecheongense]